MGLMPITDEQKIKEAFNLLSTRWQEGSQILERRVGWSGGSGNFTLYWHPSLKIWGLFEPDYTKTRYWNCFGATDPNDRKQVGIVCEINIPFKSFDRRIAGVFAKDKAKDRIYLTHSGKVGGGRPGIGKSQFLDFYRNRHNRETIDWPDGKKTQTIVIGPLDSNNLLQYIAQFVYEVERFKASASTGTLQQVDGATYIPEFSGTRKKYRINDVIESHCDHGLVISALEAELSQRGLTVGNDQARDLYVSKNDQITMLFEAKTDTTTSSIYGAIGQLMFHSAIEQSTPKRVMVLPETPKPQTQTILSKLGIVVLVYHWAKGKPIFEGIDKVL